MACPQGVLHKERRSANGGSRICKTFDVGMYYLTLM